MKEKETLTTKVLLGLIVFLLAVIAICSMIYIRAQKPEHQAKTEAIAMAEKYADLEVPDKFYWFNREKTYFTVTGKDKHDRNVVVIIPKSGDAVKIYPAADGLTEAEAYEKVKEQHPDQPFKKASIGMYEDKPVWEIVTESKDDSLNYYLLSFEDGKEVKAVHNI